MDRKFIIIVGVLMAAEITSAFETSMVVAGLQSWIEIYKDPISVGWLVTSYLLVGSSSAAICGRLGDIYGRKLVLLIVLSCCLIGSLISATAHSLELMIFGRAIQGAAGAIIPLCYGLAREHLPAERVPTAVGLIVAIAGIGAVIGLLVGGILTDAFGPHSIFWASSALAVVSLTSSLLLLPPSTPQPRTGKLDILGAVLFAPAIALLLFGMGEGSGDGWTSATALGCFATSAILLTVWTLHELRLPDPLIDVRLFANRNVLIANLVLACLAVGAFQFTQLMAMLMQQPEWTLVGLGVSATFVGVLRTPSIVTGAICSTWAGWASGRYGGRVPTLVGCGAVACALFVAVFNHSEVWVIFAVSMISGMGIQAAYAGVPNIIIAAVPPGRTSETTGLMAVVRAVSRAVGAQMLVVVLASSTIKDSVGGAQYPDNQAYTTVLAIMCGLAVLGVVLTLMLPAGQPTAKTAPAISGVGVS